MAKAKWLVVDEKMKRRPVVVEAISEGKAGEEACQSWGIEVRAGVNETLRVYPFGSSSL